MDRDPVESTTILSIGYNSISKLLEVEFKKGQVYVYSDVPEEIYNNLMTSVSIGSALSYLIKKGGYPYEKVN